MEWTRDKTYHINLDGKTYEVTVKVRCSDDDAGGIYRTYVDGWTILEVYDVDTKKSIYDKADNFGEIPAGLNHCLEEEIDWDEDLGKEKI